VLYEKELAKNAYQVLKVKRLIDYKLVYIKTFGSEKNFDTKFIGKENISSNSIILINNETEND